jgi:glycosyltransferase involved in cell wall biosynthesis
MSLMRLGRPISIVLCWPGVSGYMASCWKALAARPEVRLSVISTTCHNFAPQLVEGLDCTIMDADPTRSGHDVAAWVRQRDPDVVSIGGWSTPQFSSLVGDRSLRHVPFVLAMDNPWLGHLRQRLAPLVLSRYMRRFSCVVVPGERGWQFGRLLAPRHVPVTKGLYGVDAAMLSTAAVARTKAAEWPRRFLYVGRYAEVKAIDVLVEGYRRYRSMVDNPWQLTCCGAGDRAGLLAGEEGIRDLGFVQPRDQQAMWSEHGAFVLASRYDPWPLVIVEACTAGLPVVCSEACGSAVELVRSFYNGLTFPSESAEDLATSLAWMHAHHESLALMGGRSEQLAAAYSAEMWATRWVELARKVIAAEGQPETLGR